MKGKTASGYEFEIDESKFNDWEFLEIVAKAESDDDSKKLTASVGLVDFIFGSKKSEFIAHVRQVNGGKATPEAVFNEVAGVINAVKAIKK